MNRTALSILLLALCTPALPALAGEFVYQGHLDDRGAPANGRYDLRIAAFGDEKSSSARMQPIEFPGVEVHDGRFELRFEAALANEREVWLEVAVRDVGGGDFATLPGRSKALAAPLIGACWSSTGDTATDPSTNFLGTTDAQPLVLRTANVRSLRIEPSGVLFGGSPITANVIAGSSANTMAAGVRGATIAGGGAPLGDSDPDFDGEWPNTVSDAYGFVGGGYSNTAGDAAGTLTDKAFATVAGGRANSAAGQESFVGGGRSNSTSGKGAVVAGGIQNVAVGEGSQIAGGNMHWAAGVFAMVPGGLSNCAGGSFSLAAGYKAKVRPYADPGYGACGGIATSPNTTGDQGTFIWADSQNANLVSTGSNQFLVRAAGGLWFGTNSTPTIPAGRFLNTSTGGYLSSGGVWTDASSRTLKTGFAAIDAGNLLDRVLALPINEWSYRTAPGVRHLGPVAEDFHATFGLGEGATHIASLDTGGVALAAIQGLNAKLETENAALHDALDALRAEVAALRAQQGVADLSPPSEPAD